MSENKVVKTFLEAATPTDLVASIGWIAKKAVKENFTSDPSSNAMNYVKFTVVMAAAIALTQSLEDQKILPNEGIVYSMALVAILAGGAVINAFAFVGLNYLSRFLSGYDPEASLEEKKTWQSSRGLLSRLHQIRKRKKETPWLDWNAARNQRAGQAEFYEHRLGLQTVQPGPSTGAPHHAQWTHVLWVLPTQCS